MDRVLALPPAGRAAFIERECAADPSLLGVMRSWLAALDSSGGFLERPHGAAPGLVEGPGEADLLAWCRREHSGLRTRLRLFMQLCRSVAALHAGGAVHGRIEPGLVRVNAAGELRLLPAADGAPPPAYAAPEQLAGAPPSAAGDVHALGILLYRLLSGRAPVALGGLPPQQAIERAIQEIPSPPSAAATPDAPVAARRLRGDLDAVILRCLRKDPAQRYAGAGELERDLQRYLRRRAVSARERSRAQALRRILRRRRVLLAAAVLCSMALLTFALVRWY
jgi:hypothetical protein